MFSGYNKKTHWIQPDGSFNIFQDFYLNPRQTGHWKMCALIPNTFTKRCPSQEHLTTAPPIRKSSPKLTLFLQQNRASCWWTLLSRLTASHFCVSLPFPPWLPLSYMMPILSFDTLLAFCIYTIHVGVGCWELDEKEW